MLISSLTLGDVLVLGFCFGLLIVLGMGHWLQWRREGLAAENRVLRERLGMQPRWPDCCAPYRAIKPQKGESR